MYNPQEIQVPSNEQATHPGVKIEAEERSKLSLCLQLQSIMIKHIESHVGNLGNSKFFLAIVCNSWSSSFLFF